MSAPRSRYRWPLEGWRLGAFAALALLQVAILVALPALAERRLATSVTVELAVQPVDPLDPVRGAYVDLSYEISDVTAPPGTVPGDEVYVELVERPGSAVHHAGAVATSPNDLPSTSIFIRGERSRTGGVEFRQIETYYATQDEASRLEHELANGGIATVAIAEDGRPALRDLRAE